MTALDLSEFVSTDTPEVAAYKQKVKEVATTYAKRNNWCGEVKNALRELGIDDVKSVNIKVTTSHPFEFTVAADVSALINKTEAQQKAALALKIGSLTLAGTGVATVSIPVTGAMIATMELVPAPVNGPNWLFMNANGRVLHHWADRQLELDVYSHVYAACGRDSRRRVLTDRNGRQAERCVQCSRVIG